MASLIGGIIPTAFFFKHSEVTPDLEQETAAPFPVQIAPPKNNFVGGAKTKIPFVAREPRNALVGGIIPTAFDLFFERIHVLPSRINVGNLGGRQIRQIEVFSAFLGSSHVLNSISQSGELTGINFNVGSLPLTFKPLQSKFFELSINASGAPTFEGEFDFNFADTTAPPLEVSGRRIIVFPFRHNWTQNVEETLDYLTKIYARRNDDETARKLRAFPRRRVKFLHAPIETNDLNDVAELRAEMEALIRGWQERVYAVPLWQHAARLAEPLVAGAVAVPVATVGKDYDIGRYLLLQRGARNIELVEIADITNSQVQLARPLSFDWNLGTVVLPARLARLAAEVNFDDVTKTTAQFSTEWLLEPNERSTHRIGTFAAPVYRGFPVWLNMLEGEAGGQIGVSRKQSVIDFQFGLRRVVSLAQSSRGKFNFFGIAKNAAEIAAFLGWLDQRAGRLNPAWFPTWQKDFQLVSTAAANATSITVRGNRFSTFYETASNRQDVCLRFVDQQLLFRRVLSATANNDGTENLALDSPLPRETTVANLDRVCFLQFARLESDSVKLVWRSPELLTCNAPLLEMQISE